MDAELKTINLLWQDTGTDDRRAYTIVRISLECCSVVMGAIGAQQSGLMVHGEGGFVDGSKESKVGTC